MRINIIGGLGFVGSSLITHLQKSSYLILDKRVTERTDNSFYCDICDKESLSGLIKSDDIVVLLAAEHRDDVSPVTRYYETNVQGTLNVLNEMDKVGCTRIVFTSSVAVYGLNKINPDENHELEPFNHYGSSKFQAERLIKEWYDRDKARRSATIIRPTVIFGENNRGNVYNLMKKIVDNRFAIIGSGLNKKSMAYIENISSFMSYIIEEANPGYNIYNYTDEPDLTMLELMGIISKYSNTRMSPLRIPLWLGYFIGYAFDMIAFITNKKFDISLVRIKKLTASTQYNSSKLKSTGFNRPFSLKEGIVRTIDFEFMRK